MKGKNKKVTPANQSKSKTFSNLSGADRFLTVMLLLGYGYITVMTPNLMTLDSNGPKFLALAVLNIIGWIYLIYTEHKYKNLNSVAGFFKSKTGVVYALFIVMLLLSFTKSINVIESVVQFARLFTTFVAAWVISVLLTRNPKSLNFLIVAMAGLLLFDGLRVFKETINYIQGDIDNISLIKAGYSNKNILAAALFVKLPFAIWLITFKKGWVKKMGIVSLFCGLTAVFFMSARAFYLGLILLTIAYSAFLIIRYRQTREKSFLKILAIFSISLVLAFLVFTIVQSTLYPQSKSRYNQGFTGRIASVTEDNAGGGRLKFWKMTTELIKENPVLGVGLGNWKIVILEKENPMKSGFKYMFKVHNDFLEVSSETGIIGGLTYISIFLIIVFALLKSLYNKATRGIMEYNFLAAFGIIAYSFDAFFNFPNDRPEIQSLFAIYVGASVAISSSMSQNARKNSIQNNVSLITYRKPIRYGIFTILMLASISSSAILYLNFKSLKIQRIIRDQRNSEKKNYDSDFLIKSFPSIPNLSAVGDPINSLIAKQMLSEEKYESVIEILKKENPSPFDTRREFYLSLAYFNLKMYDSAQHYIDIAYNNKPLYYLYTKQYANVLEKMEQDQKAISKLDTFLIKNKKKKEAWKYHAALHKKVGNKEEVLAGLDSALKYFPEDKKLEQLKDNYLYNFYMPHYQKAIKHYESKNYEKAIKYFRLSEQGYKKAGGYDRLPDFLNSWARSHLNIDEVSSAKRLFLRVYKKDPKNYYALINLGNIAFHHEENYDKAVHYFKASLKANNPDLWLSHKNLGTLYLIKGKKELAIEHYENALQYGSSEPVIKNLFLLWQEKGDKGKIDYYNSLLKEHK